jgi:hypothetical protein
MYVHIDPITCVKYSVQCNNLANWCTYIVQMYK